ncbi:hypothetical protein A2335_00890 [Candidatus Peregrinibacteria bacterium RIFOXYB2_FULL_32_7]|nr:MAG: hypothetical protein A2335_00890 [Candidatus Peregrinibacteria bacterium RIFOXYB2_FULL_32_7]
MLDNFLKSLELSEKEALVYLTMLRIGSQGVSIVAKKSGLSRTTCYHVLESLQKKGYVSSYEKNKIDYYNAESPEIFQYILEKKERELQEQKTRFIDLLPDFLNLRHGGEIMPKVRYFEGLQGIKEIYEDTLKEGKNKLAYSSIPDIQIKELKDYIENYLERRAKLGIKVRAIFPDTEKSREFIKNDKNLLRESRLINAKKYPFRSEINIYGNKIAYMSLDTNFLHGVIIESEAIVETERSIFELAWLNS